MKKMLIVMLISSYAAFSQTTVLPTGRIKIGDKMPDYEIKNLINYPQSSVKTSTFKGKILILDFWTRGCVACVESWPKLIKLQEDFKDQIQIITVNPRDSEEMVATFIHNREKVFKYKMTLPISCGDIGLKQMFPHAFVPHIIFIDRQGYVKYIAAGRDLSAETITSMIANKAMQIAEKTDIYTKVDWRKPVFVGGNGGTEETGGKLLWTSAIKEYNSNISGFLHIEKRKGYSYGAMVNMTIHTMFKSLYGPVNSKSGAQLMLSNAQIVLKATDTNKLVSHVKGSLIMKNFYGIQVTAQKEIPVQDLKLKMITELEDFFGLKTKWETERRKCLVFSRNSRPILKYETGKRTLGIGNAKLIINNVSVQELIDQLSSDQFSKFPYPIIDDTHFAGHLGNIQVEVDVKNYKSLGEALYKYGLSLSIEERDVRVLTIQNKS